MTREELAIAMAFLLLRFVLAMGLMIFAGYAVLENMALPAVAATFGAALLTWSFGR